MCNAIMRLSGTGRAKGMSKGHGSDRYAEYQQTLHMQAVTQELVTDTSTWAFAFQPLIDLGVSDDAWGIGGFEI